MVRLRFAVFYIWSDSYASMVHFDPFHQIGPVWLAVELESELLASDLNQILVPRPLTQKRFELGAVVLFDLQQEVVLGIVD